VPGHQAPDDLIYPDHLTPNKSLIGPAVRRRIVLTFALLHCRGIQCRRRRHIWLASLPFFLYMWDFSRFVKITKLGKTVSQIRNDVGLSYEAPFGAHIWHNTNNACPWLLDCEHKYCFLHFFVCSISVLKFA